LARVGGVKTTPDFITELPQPYEAEQDCSAALL
jgi:hypothetical protein